MYDEHVSQSIPTTHMHGVTQAQNLRHSASLSPPLIPPRRLLFLFLCFLSLLLLVPLLDLDDLVEGVGDADRASTTPRSP